MAETIELRQLTTINELQQVQQLEEAVWNMKPIPIHQTLTAVKNGGIMVGAYQGEKLIGFSYGFAGFQNGRTYLCSHMLGIDEGLRGQGIGALLKEAQKQAAIDKGYKVITWTYDPLESVNAFLNLSKLKAICSTYIENCYGDMEDSLNQGLASDRFQVEWWIQSRHVAERNMDDAAAAKRIPYELTAAGQPKLVNVDASLLNEQEAWLIPIPKHFQEIKKDHLELALDWRLKTRRIFQTLFNKGYAAVKVVKTADEPVHYYLVKKRDTLPLESEDQK
ncbi:GNAT family N-acetyltransferase [Neobacillus mesonae]|uniref:GNAT family N-acetyltransferase n=1 Tax=Neobacillus mesonae TaxID=1193713 RepID=UPI00082D5DB2|nr:GNAT family N-acetyltransferase [Neobacillus mesonae]MED4203541.1 GNAT family N-acetyltransferase [Neobacillus mesonae]